VLRPGFEPGSRDREWCQFVELNYDEYRAELVQWFKRRGIRDGMKYIRYLDRMLSGRVIRHPRELAQIVQDKTRHHKVAVRDFLKFLVESGYYTKSQIIDYQEVVKLGRTGIRPASQAFTTTDKIIQAFEYLKSINSTKKILILKLLVFSGLRLTEACDILKNFNESELIILEDKKIARYDLLAMYKRIGSSKAKAEVTKRAWVAYIPADFAKELLEVCPIEVSEEAMKGKRFCNGIILPNQTRKWFSNFLKDNGVPERVIEFMTGKTPERVLRQFYFDLLKEADEWYFRIVDKFPIR
jgi:intergrase/recombinase